MASCRHNIVFQGVYFRENTRIAGQDSHYNKKRIGWRYLSSSTLNPVEVVIP